MQVKAYLLLRQTLGGYQPPNQARNFPQMTNLTLLSQTMIDGRLHSAHLVLQRQLLAETAMGT